MKRTRKIKVRPESYNWLNCAAGEVNFVWNWANETSYKALTPFFGKRAYLSSFDMINLASGATKETEYIGAESINLVCDQYVKSRTQFKKFKLKWRSSGGRNRSLGWIPLKPSQMAKRKGDRFRFAGKQIRLFEKIEGYKFKQGCFAQDSLGDWYLCMPYEYTEEQTIAPVEACGIDLGNKTAATTSGGEKLETRYYRASEKKIAQLQRRGHKKQAKFVHRKVKRQRDHAVHNFSTQVVKKYQNIFIGDVSFNFLKSGNGAKSAYDAATSKLKAQLHYKGQQAGRRVEVISEKYTTQACSACGALTGPVGRTGLDVRDWQCTECGSVHDRDTNAAINICHLGMKLHPPFAGTSKTCDEAVTEQRIRCEAGMSDSHVRHESWLYPVCCRPRLHILAQPHRRLRPPYLQLFSEGASPV